MDTIINLSNADSTQHNHSRAGCVTFHLRIGRYCGSLSLAVETVIDCNVVLTMHNGKSKDEMKI